MELGDNILKLLGIFSTAFALYMLVRDSPFKLRSSKAVAEKSSFELYTQALKEVEDCDEKVNTLRDRLDLEIERGDDQEEKLKLLLRQGNTQDSEIKRIERRAKRSDDATAEYRDKWEAVQLEARNLTREVKILRAVLRKHGLLTPEIEKEIATGLELPPGSTPPEGTPSIPPVPDEPTP